MGSPCSARIRPPGRAGVGCRRQPATCSFCSTLCLAFSRWRERLPTPVGRARPCGDSPFGTARVRFLCITVPWAGWAAPPERAARSTSSRTWGRAAQGLYARILVAELEDVEGVEDDRLGTRNRTATRRCRRRAFEIGPPVGGYYDNLTVEDDIAERGWDWPAR